MTEDATEALCAACSATGAIDGRDCARCGGRGRIGAAEREETRKRAAVLAAMRRSQERPLRALGEMIIIDPVDEPETSPSRRLVVVRHDPLVFRIGIVHSIGPEAARLIPALREGDRVLYSQSVSAKPMADRHVVHHSAVLCTVDEGIDVQDLDPRWLGVSAQRVELRPRETVGVGKWTKGRTA